MSIYFPKERRCFLIPCLEKQMKKLFFWLTVFLFLFFAPRFFENPKKGAPYKTLSDLSLECWQNLMESPEVREVFDLEEAEAKEVFGPEGEAYFL